MSERGIFYAVDYPNLITAVSILAAKERIIFAVDYPNLAMAIPILDKLQGQIRCVKVGLELFTREGPRVVAECRARGFDVFLDLKLHDIPVTVERAVGNLCQLGVACTTIHIGGGPAMIAAAVNRCAFEGAGMTLVGVTVLTSLDTRDLSCMNIHAGVADQVLTLCKLGFGEGLRAFVCSPREAGRLRQKLGSEGVLITPGIRLEGGDLGDQKRVTTPRAAMAAGADLLVIGRPIHHAPDPIAAIERCAKEIDAGMQDYITERRVSDLVSATEPLEPASVSRKL